MNPNLFLIGAPKCATTSLTRLFESHPQIQMSSIKEPNYFYTPYGSPMTESEYISLFDVQSSTTKYRAEGSVWYLQSSEAIQRILDFNPEAKFIVSVRHPVELFVSLHNQKVKSGHEKLLELSDAWNASDRRISGEHYGIEETFNLDPTHMAYKKVCDLKSQLEYLESILPDESFYLTSLEKLTSNPEKEVRLILTWLGLNTKTNLTLPYLNKRSRHRSKKIAAVIENAGILKRNIFGNTNLGIQNAFRRANSTNSVGAFMDEQLRCKVENELSSTVAYLRKLDLI